MPNSKPRVRKRRKTPELFGFIVAWLEERRVCSKAIDLVLPTLRNQWLRPEVEAKLSTLDRSIPLHADLHRRVTLSLELLEAIERGAYRPPRDWAKLQPWLCRALSYFTTNGDSIPDHFEDGFEDDHREFVDLGERLGVLMDHFESWRSRRKR